MTMDLANKEEWPSRKEGSEVVLKEGRKEGRRIQIPVRSLFQTRFRLFQTSFSRSSTERRQAQEDLAWFSLNPFIDGIFADTCFQTHSQSVWLPRGRPAGHPGLVPLPGHSRPAKLSRPFLEQSLLASPNSPGRANGPLYATTTVSFQVP